MGGACTVLLLYLWKPSLKFRRLNKRNEAKDRPCDTRELCPDIGRGRDDEQYILMFYRNGVSSTGAGQLPGQGNSDHRIYGSINPHERKKSKDTHWAHRDTPHQLRALKQSHPAKSTSPPVGKCFILHT